MKKHSKRFWGACIAAICACLVVLGIFLMAQGAVPGTNSSEQQSDPSDVHKVELKEETEVYDPKTSDYTITGADDESLTLSKTDKVKEGTILVSGITDETPEGLLVEVTSVQEEGDHLRAETKPAPLTAAIKTCSASFTASFDSDGNATIIDNKVDDVTTAESTNTTVNSSDDATRVTKQTSYESVNDPFIKTAEAETLNRSLTEELFSYDKGPLDANAAYSLHFDLDIYWDNVECKLYIQTNANADLDLAKTLTFNENKELYQKDFKPVEFKIGPIPVVITNSLAVDGSANGSMAADLLTATATLDESVGLSYSTRDGVKPYLENRSEAPKITFEPDGDLIKATLDGDITVSYEGRLYGIAGPNISVGINDLINADLEAYKGDAQDETISIDGLDITFAGTLTEKATLPVSGSFKIELPDFLNPFDKSGHSLKDYTIFHKGDTITLLDKTEHFTVPSIKKIKQELDKGRSAKSTSEASVRKLNAAK